MADEPGWWHASQAGRRGGHRWPFVVARQPRDLVRRARRRLARLVGRLGCRWSDPSRSHSRNRSSRRATWSPTRDVIAYVSATTSGPTTSRLAFVDPSGAPVDLALPELARGTVGGFQNGTLAWAPDGGRLAAVTQGYGGGYRSGLSKPNEASPYRKVTDLSGGPRLRGITWTRDGSAIIVGKHDVASSDIVIMNAAP